MQAAALAEEARRTQRRAQPLQAGTEVLGGARAAATNHAAGPAAAGANAAPSVSRPCMHPDTARSPCQAAYDRAHAALAGAACLVWDTETSGFAGCVLDIGWVLADSSGAELASYSQLWRLPARERIHSQAYREHKISAATLADQGVDPKPELLEVFALISEALARSIPVVAHNASFDVGRLNHTALRHGVSVTPLRYVSMLCTMHNATKHCRLRKRGGKAFKPPRNEELFEHLFNRKPQGRLHRALPDCRVTLACFMKGRQLHWW